MPPFQLQPEQVKAEVPRILELGQAFFAGQCLNAVVRMGVADAMGDSTLSVADLAARLEGKPHEEMLFRCMRLLALHGVFVESAGPGGEFLFALTPMGALLQTKAPMQPSMACGMLHWNEKCMWDAWATVPDLAAGKIEAPTPFQAANSMPIFEYYANHPKSAKQFNEFMTFFSGGELPVVLEFLPWATLTGKKVVDIGGNLGTVMGAVKAKFPEVEAISFDLPEVIATVAEPPPGVELVPGDMFKSESIPQADAIIMKHILHDWSDENSIKILGSCAAALADNGKIFLIECVLPDAGQMTELKGSQVHLDALMMVIGGKERTAAQWSNLATAASLRIAETIATPMPAAQIVVLTK